MSEGQVGEHIKRQQYSILIVEDHEITRIGLRAQLEKISDFSIVAEAGDGGNAVARAGEFRPNVILLDLQMPVMNGISALRRIKEQSLDAKVIVLTSFQEQTDIAEAFDAGASGYALKDISLQQLELAIRCVCDGGIWLDPAVAKQVVTQFIGGQRAQAHTTGGAAGRGAGRTLSFGLSARELEVTMLIVEGMSNKRIAESLVVSTETVKTHVRNVMKKLLVTDRTQVAVKALQEGIVPGKAAAEQQASP